MKRVYSIALATCICLVFICAVLATGGSRGDSSSQTLLQAIVPYIAVVGRDPDEVHPGSMETTLLWGLHDPVVVVVRRFEKIGWKVVAFYQSSEQTVPPEWVALMMTFRQREQRLTDPWGNVITDMNVLCPEQRWK